MVVTVIWSELTIKTEECLYRNVTIFSMTSADSLFTSCSGMVVTVIRSELTIKTEECLAQGRDKGENTGLGSLQWLGLQEMMTTRGSTLILLRSWTGRRQ